MCSGTVVCRELLLAQPSPTKAAPTPNPHSRLGAHRLPAGSFIGGFRTPAPLPGSIAHAWPASETLPDSGPSLPRPGTARLDPNRSLRRRAGCPIPAISQRCPKAPGGWNPAVRAGGLASAALGLAFYSGQEKRDRCNVWGKPGRSGGKNPSLRPRATQQRQDPGGFDALPCMA
jgi:hypothetical protein